MVALLEGSISTSPYPGLRPFRSYETNIFFGREEQTDQLLKRLRNSHFLAVVGSSGCGKSSLVRAGMIAALGAGFLTDAGTRWRVAEMRPGEEPLERLAKALLSPSALGHERYIESDDVAFVQATLCRGPRGLIEVLQEKPPPEGTNLLLLVDQFEEIFRFRREGDPDEAGAFVALLLASAVQREVPIYVVITMRSDFLGDCALFNDLPETMNDNQFLTPRLKREESEAAIMNPARVFGGRVDPVLVNRLLNDMGSDPDQLPLLQHALMRMWANVTKRSEEPSQKVSGDIQHSIQAATLTLDDYTAVGGVNALSDHAEEVYGSLNERQQHIAEVMFRRLTERGIGKRDTRRPTRLSDMAEVAEAKLEEVMAVVDEFRKSNRSFVTPPEGVSLREETVLDIGHESLIRQWKRLNEWVNQEAESADTYQRLNQWAISWKKEGLELWGGISLVKAREWKANQNPTEAWASRYSSIEEYAAAMEFLEKSETDWRKKQAHRQDEEIERRYLQAKARTARKFQWLTGALALLVLLLTGTGIWALKQEREAEMARRSFEKASDNSKQQMAQIDLLKQATTSKTSNQNSGQQTSVKVAFVSNTDKVSYEELSRVAAALQTQVTRDFAPVWGITATVTAYREPRDAPVTDWLLIIMDDIGEPGAEGVHENKDGHPIALVTFDEGWSLTASHELLNMLVDPDGNRTMPGPSPYPKDGGQKVELLVEPCDPSQDDKYGYKIDGVLVSDFVFPSYYTDTGAVDSKYSFTGAVNQPRQVLKNGYLSWHNPVSDHWMQLTFFGGRKNFVNLGVLN
jgi:hypothetical protein